MAMWGESIDGAITGAASKYGVAPELLRTFAKIESSGRPNARTGSYKGLFQLSDSEFNKYGGSGNIFDPQANANAAAQKLAAQTSAFKAKYGRDPTPNDLYMIHQQGEGGYAAHTRNPNAPAWQNMYSTAEGRQKGPGWAKQAIWGNVPSDVRAKYPGGVDSLTSQQFLDLWNDKVNRMGSGMLGRALIGGRPEVEAGTGYVSGTGATPTGGPMPAQMPPEALVAPSGRYSKLADALMASAAGAKPRGWGDLLNASGDLALGYTLADKADTRQQEYQSKLSQMLSGADPNTMADTLIRSGDPALMQAGAQAKIQQAQAQAKANAPLRGKERYMSTPGGVMDVETMQIVPGTEKDDGNKPIKVGDTLVQKGPDGKYAPVYAPDPGKADPDRVKLEQGLRKEFAALSKDYRSIEEGADRVRVGSELNNAVGDLSLIFGYMKLLDPGSVVREGEFANAENAQGVPDRIRNTWNKIMSGERLNPQTRQEFVQAANKLAEQQVGRQNRIVEQFKGIAGEAGLDPERIIMDFGPSESAPPPPSGGDTALPPPPPPAPGEVVDGYRFKGGDPADQNSWEKVQ